MLIVRAVPAGNIDPALVSPSFAQENASLLRQSAETLLQRTVAEAIGSSQIPALWHKLPNGKPVFTHLPLHFSLSHTQGWVAVAISDAPVGVDIEHAARIEERLLRRLAAPATLGLSPVEQWACWEAQGKCSGRGVAVMFDPQPPEASIPCRFLEISEGLVLAVAGEKAEEWSLKF